MKKPILLAAIVAPLALVAGYFFVLPKFKGTPAEALDDEGPAVTAAAKPAAGGRSTAAAKKKRNAEPGLIYPAPDRIFNLRSAPGERHYARIELAIEFEKPAGEKGSAAKKKEGAPAKSEGPVIDPLLEPVVARKAQIDDALTRIVGAKTADELSTTAGQEALKAEILEAVTEIVPTMDPLAVYIVRLIVQ